MYFGGSFTTLDESKDYVAKWGSPIEFGNQNTVDD
jgi:hypothetical protein